MKKILFMVTSMNIGGVEKSLLSLIAEIPKNKYIITILLLERKGGFLKDVPDWVQVKEVNWYEKVKPIVMQPPQKTINDYYKNKRYIKALIFVCIYLLSKHLNCRYIFYRYVLHNVKNYREEYDIAISYQGPTDIIDYYIGNKVTAKRRISWVHFDVSKHEINAKLYEKLYGKFSEIFVVSKSAKGKLIEQIPSIIDKTKVFTNIISEKIIKEMSQEQIDFDEGYKGIRIVTVGRLAKEKGQDIAIRVLYRLRQSGYEVRWYCIGEGNERKEYKRIIKNCDLEADFFLLGAKTNPYPYMAQSDIYIQPSRHEGYCLTLAEAKCLNKPIITTDFIGAREQIIDGYNGYIVGFDEKQISDKIKFLIENHRIRSSLSGNLISSNSEQSTALRRLLKYVD